MSDNRLEEIRARLEAATPGPWTNNYNGWITKAVAHYLPTGLRNQICGYCSSRADATFIAAAPDDIRYLLAEVERLEAEASHD